MEKYSDFSNRNKIIKDQKRDTWLDKMVDSKCCQRFMTTKACKQQMLSQYPTAEVMSSEHEDESKSNNQACLMKAIEDGDRDTAKAIIGRCVDLSLPDRHGNTALHVALKLGQYDLATYILQFTTNCNIANESGMTPLHIVAEGKQVKLAQNLLNHGANVHLVDKKGRTPLILASKRGHFPMVSLLLKYHSQPQLKDYNGWMASDYASVLGYTQITNILNQYIRSGVNVKVGTSEDNLTDEDERDQSLMHRVCSMRELPDHCPIPITIEKDNKQASDITVNLMRTQDKISDKKPEYIHDSKGNLLSVPQVVAAMRSSASQLGELQSWVSRQQQIMESKQNQSEALKQKVEILLREKTELLEKRENLQKRITDLSDALEEAPRKRMAEILRKELMILKSGLAELQGDHDKVANERNELKSILEDYCKLQETISQDLEAKAEQLKEDNEMLYKNLQSTRNSICSITDDLNQKCKISSRLVNHFKMLLRGTYKVLEEKHNQTTTIIEGLNVQQKLMNITKSSHNSMKEERSLMGKTMDDLDQKAIIILKQMARINKRIVNHPLLKKLIEAGVMDEFGDEIKKSHNTEDRSKYLKQAKYSKESDGDEKSEYNCDPTGIMSAPVQGPTACQSRIETVAYSWKDAETTDLVSKDNATV